MPDNQPSTDDDIGSVIDSVKAYARQEIVDPVKGAPRWIGFGLGGAMAAGIGLAFIVLGALRLMQTEWPGTFHHVGQSIFAYLIALAICVLVILFSITRIKKTTLEKGSKR